MTLPLPSTASVGSLVLRVPLLRSAGVDQLAPSKRLNQMLIGETVSSCIQTAIARPAASSETAGSKVNSVELGGASALTRTAAVQVPDAALKRLAQISLPVMPPVQFAPVNSRSSHTTTASPDALAARLGAIPNPRVSMRVGVPQVPVALRFTQIWPQWLRLKSSASFHATKA